MSSNDSFSRQSTKFCKPSHHRNTVPVVATPTSTVPPKYTNPFDSDLWNTTPVIVTPTSIVHPETISNLRLQTLHQTTLSLLVLDPEIQARPVSLENITARPTQKLALLLLQNKNTPSTPTTKKENQS
jgi:hypothetical protein